MFKNSNKSIKQNFIMNSILNLSSIIFPLITFPYISRILLPVGTGKIGFATSFISYFVMFAQLGIPTYGVRECAKVRDNRLELSRTAQELLIINLIMSFFAYIVLFLALEFIPRLQEDKTLYLIISSTILLTAIGMEWIYRGLEQYTYITIRSIVFKLMAMIAMFLLVHHKSDYVVYGVITIFASVASNIMNFIHVTNYISLKPVGGYNFRKHLKPISVFFFMSCATTIYTNLDAVMLKFMTNDIEVGYYDEAIKIKGVLVSIVTSLGTVLLPRSSYYLENKNYKEFYNISQKAFNFVFVFAMPITLYFSLFARESIYLISSSAYEGAVIPMIFIMPTVLIIGITNIIGIQMYVPLGKQRIVLRSEICGALTDFAVNLLFIPLYGGAGAAIGTLLAELSVFMVQFKELREDKKMFRTIKVLKIICALLVGVAFSYWIKYFGLTQRFGETLGSLLILTISSILFFASYSCTLIFLREPFAVYVKDEIKQYIIKRIKRFN